MSITLKWNTSTSTCNALSDQILKANIFSQVVSLTKYQVFLRDSYQAESNPLVIALFLKADMRKWLSFSGKDLS